MAHTVVDPWAVVVHAQDAAPANATMVSAWRFVVPALLTETFLSALQ